MMTPAELKLKMELIDEENYKFRTFLKNRANVDELDKQFLELHNELFNNYDCSACRNCCKEYSGTLSEAEIEQVASLLNMTRDTFLEQYISEREDGEYVLKGLPCCFLDETYKCRIEKCKPQSCKEYPHTNKPGRFWSLLSIVASASVCPVVYEILQRLKPMYGFKSDLR